LLRFSGRGPNDYSVVTAPVFDSGILECETWEQTAETLKKIKGL